MVRNYKISLRKATSIVAAVALLASVALAGCSSKDQVVSDVKKRDRTVEINLCQQVNEDDDGNAVGTVNHELFGKGWTFEVPSAVGTGQYPNAVTCVKPDYFMLSGCNPARPAEPCLTMFNVWKENGNEYNNGIAAIGGCRFVAMAPEPFVKYANERFKEDGDVIGAFVDIEYADGHKITVIITDAKGVGIDPQGNQNDAFFYEGLHWGHGSEGSSHGLIEPWQNYEDYQAGKVPGNGGYHEDLNGDMVRWTIYENRVQDIDSSKIKSSSSSTKSQRNARQSEKKKNCNNKKTLGGSTSGGGTQQELFDIAKAEVGNTAGESASSNKYLKDLGLGDGPWCSEFAQWCFYKAFGDETGKKLLGLDKWADGGSTIYNAAKSRNMGHDSDPKPGDIVYTDNFSHCAGIVYEVNGDEFKTYEGNVGGTVKDSTHNVSGNYHFSTPDWSVLDGSSSSGGSSSSASITPADPSSFVSAQSSEWKHGSLPKDKVKYIMMHDTESGTDDAQAIINAWKGNGVAAHFMVDKTGKIFSCVPIDTITHHAGWGNTNDLFGITQERDDSTEQADAPGKDYAMNANSIGIEIVHDHGGGDYPEEQLNAVDSLVAYLDKELGHEAEIIDHKEWTGSPSTSRAKVQGQGKQDCDDNFPLDSYKSSRNHGGTASGSKNDEDEDEDCNDPCSDGGEQVDNEDMGEGAEGAVAWAIKVANSKTVGYSQDGGDTGNGREGVQHFDGKNLYNADCTAFCWWSWVVGGKQEKIRAVSPDWGPATGSFSEYYPKAGFEEHDFNESELKPGDVLWTDGHAALYIGNGKLAEASGPEGGGVYGEKGDQLQTVAEGEEDTGGEVHINNLYTFTKYWRYKG